MKKVKNPNDIVNDFVADYKNILGDTLVSVIMYGSAVTHEYRPGKSDINMAIVLTDDSIKTLKKIVPVQKKWGRYAVAVPFYMTEQYIASSLDTYPVEFMTMQSSYRVLYGKDPLAQLAIKKEHVRLQCERELKGIIVHLRREFVQSQGAPRALSGLVDHSFKKLLPLFKALIFLYGKKVPHIKSEIIGIVEDMFQLGASVLSEIYSPADAHRVSEDLFARYVGAIDTICQQVDLKIEKGE